MTSPKKTRIRLAAGILAALLLFAGCGTEPPAETDPNPAETEAEPETVLPDETDETLPPEPTAETVAETDATPSETAAPAPDEPLTEANRLSLFANGRAAFKLVRAGDDPAAEDGASALVKAVNALIGKKFKLTDDASEEQEYEILIGETNRAASRETAETYASALADGQYVIAAAETKICLLAPTVALMRAAVDEFTANWLKSKSIDVPRGGVAMGRTEPITLTALDGSTRPAAIPPLHETRGAVIADVVAADYGTDPTGQKDSTNAIRRALKACAELGGGTVWLGAGQYLVTGTIEIPAFVSLCGERPLETIAKPEDYGTVILARPKSGEDTAQSLFILRGSCGVVGMTVYYPDQSLDDPKPYPYTFYVPGNGVGGYMLQTVEDVLVVNGWDGIGACVTENNAHEQTTVENFRGTFLHSAVASFNEADVGTFKSIRVSPAYWAESLLGDAPSLDTVRAYTRENATGLVLGDLEWDQLADIYVEDCKIGLHTVAGKRATFTGEMVDVTVKNCADALIADVLDSRWGMNLAKAIFTNCPGGVSNKSSGVVKITGCAIDGKITRRNLTADGDLSGYTYDYNATWQSPSGGVYTANLRADADTDIAAELQDALNQVSAAGGGVLYLPAGTYRVNAPVTVPSGVEVRGASSVPTRDQNGCSKGTLVVTSYGLGRPETDTALFTLETGAGVNGMRFVYAENGPAKAATTPYVIRGAGEGVYCVNSAFVAAGSGIDFAGCDGHFVKKVTACCYDHGIRVGGKNGVVEGCLQNATTMMRHGMNFLEGWISEGEVFAKLFPILRSRSVFLTIDGAEGERVLNYFAYGVKTVVETFDSRDIVIFNLGGDNIGDKAPLIRAERSEMTVVNAQRYNGVLYKTDGESDFSLYNPLSVDNKREPNVIHGEEAAFTKTTE